MKRDESPSNIGVDGPTIAMTGLGEQVCHLCQYGFACRFRSPNPLYLLQHHYSRCPCFGVTLLGLTPPQPGS